MLEFNELTNKYKHCDVFAFHGNQYYTHSIVKLTPYGKLFLQSVTINVVLTEEFVWWNGKTCWKYHFRRWPSGITTAITDEPPDKLIECIAISASKEYSSIETLGSMSPYYFTGRKRVITYASDKNTAKKWLIFIGIFIVAEIFKYPEFKWFIRGMTIFMFMAHRIYNKKQNTVYIRDEDIPIIRETCNILYGTNKNYGGDCNE